MRGLLPLLLVPAFVFAEGAPEKAEPQVLPRVLPKKKGIEMQSKRRDPSTETPERVLEIKEDLKAFRELEL